MQGGIPSIALTDTADFTLGSGRVDSHSDYTQQPTPCGAERHRSESQKSANAAAYSIYPIKMKHSYLRNIPRFWLFLATVFLFVVVSSVSFWLGQKRGKQIGDARTAIEIALLNYEFCRKLANNPSAENIEDLRAWSLLYINTATQLLRQNPKAFAAAYPNSSYLLELITTIEEYLHQELANVIIEDAFPGIEVTPNRIFVIKHRNKQASNPPEEELTLPEQTEKAENRQMPDSAPPQAEELKPDSKKQRQPETKTASAGCTA